MSFSGIVNPNSTRTTSTFSVRTLDSNGNVISVNPSPLYVNAVSGSITVSDLSRDTSFIAYPVLLSVTATFQDAMLATSLI